MGVWNPIGSFAVSPAPTGGPLRGSRTVPQPGQSAGPTSKRHIGGAAARLRGLPVLAIYGTAMAAELDSHSGEL